MDRREEVEREMHHADVEPPAVTAHMRLLAKAVEEARHAIEPSLVEVWGKVRTLRKDKFRLSGEGAAWRELIALETWLVQTRQASVESSADAAWLGFNVEQARTIVSRLRLRRTPDLIAALRRVYETGTLELRCTFQDNASALITDDDPAAREFLDQLAHDRLERTDNSPGNLQIQSEREELAHTLLDAYRQTRRAVSLLGTDTLTRRSYLGNVLKGVQIECRRRDGCRRVACFTSRTRSAARGLAGKARQCSLSRRPSAYLPSGCAAAGRCLASSTGPDRGPRIPPDVPHAPNSARKRASKRAAASAVHFSSSRRLNRKPSPPSACAMVKTPSQRTYT